MDFLSGIALCIQTRIGRRALRHTALRHSGATALSLCTVIHFWNWGMDLNSYSPILQKARQFALDGDYMSAQSYYEETKSLMEKDKKRLTTPSIKRVGMIVSIENRCTTRYPLNYPR